MMEKGILDRLAAGPVVGDGGYLLELEKRGYVQAGPFTPEVSITNPQGAPPDAPRVVPPGGADVLQALTFYASEKKLATVGLGDKVDEINKAAV
jgi:betaine-homocysteine S-methyltransferase